MNSPIVKTRCHWVSTTKSKSNSVDTLSLAKLRHLHEDGTETSEVRPIRNFERPYYITKKGLQSEHKQKRDWESYDRVVEYRCTDAALAAHAQKNLLGYSKSGFTRLMEVNRSPYLYGTDITASTLIKESFNSKFKDYTPKARIGVIDYETDMLSDDGYERIISGAVTTEGISYLAVTKHFLRNYIDPEVKIQAKFDTYIGQLREQLDEIADADLKRKTDGDDKAGFVHGSIQKFKALILDRLTFDFDIVENDFEVSKACMDVLHKAQPDYAMAWNMNFDIKKMLQSCDLTGNKYSDLFVDKRVPEDFSIVDYVEGKQIKEKSNGESSSVGLLDLWHTMNAPASMEWVCPMAFRRLNRIMEGMPGGSSLEYALMEELGIGKLKFEFGDGYEGRDLHEFLQLNHPIDYLIYNVFDCLLVELYDIHTNDISITLGTYLRNSPLQKAKSNPSRLADESYFFLRDRGKVIQSVSDQLLTDMDKLLIKPTNWIITLPAELQQHTGRSMVYGIPDEFSRLSSDNGDIDLESSYPTNGTVMNISNGTTRMEMYSMDGITEETQRRAGVDFTACDTNSVQLAREFYKAKTLNEALAYF